MPVNDASMLAAFRRVEAYATIGWKIPAAKEAKDTILELTEKGQDADGLPFPRWSDFHPEGKPGHTYSPAQEAVRGKLGLRTDIKNLTLGRLGLLKGLKPRLYDKNIILAVADDATAKLNKIAHGQMYHDKWRYHHKFLANGAIMMARVMAVVTAPLLRGKSLKTQ